MATKKSEQIETDGAAVEQETEAPVAPAIRRYAITFAPAGERGGCPEELNVGLPNGGNVFMNANHPGKLGDAGYPYAEALLSEDAAREWAAHYRLHGLRLTPIEASALPRHPIHNADEA